MGLEDLTTLDETFPKGSIEPVSVLDNYQRETRAKLKANLAVEHDLATGQHKLSILPVNTSNGRMYYDRIRQELLYYFKDAHYDSWRSVIQPPFNMVFNPDFQLIISATTGRMGAGWQSSIPVGGWVGIDENLNFRILGRNSCGFNNPAASGTYAVVFQDMSVALPRWLPIDYWRGRTITFGAFVFCEEANRAFLQINDGSVITSSMNQFSGNSQWDWLVATHTVSAGATGLTVGIANAPGASACSTYFCCPTLVEGTWCTRPTLQGHPNRTHMLSMGHVNANAQAMNLTRYFGHFGRSGNEFLVSDIIPYRFLARNLNVYSTTAPGAGQQLDCRIRYNNTSDSDLTCVISGTNGSAQDDTHTLLGAANGTISLRVTGSATVANTTISATIAIDELPW